MLATETASAYPSPYRHGDRQHREHVEHAEARAPARPPSGRRSPRSRARRRRRSRRRERRSRAGVHDAQVYHPPGRRASGTPRHARACDHGRVSTLDTRSTARRQADSERRARRGGLLGAARGRGARRGGHRRHRAAEAARARCSSLGVLYVFAVLPVAVVWGLALRGRRSRSRACSRSTSSSCRRCTRSRCGLAELVRARRLRRDGGRRQRARGALAPAGARVGAARRDRDARCSSAATSARELERIAAEAARRAAGRARDDRARRRGADAGGRAHPLLAGGRRVGTIYLERPRRGSAAARRRLLPGARLAARRRDRPRAARRARRSRPRRCAAATR